MLPAILLLLSVVLFRLAPWGGDGKTLEAVAGFSPLMAFALCAGVFFPGRRAVGLATVAAAVSCTVINLRAGESVIHYYTVLLAVFTAVLAVAGSVVKTKSAAAVLGVSFLGTVLFHLVSNTVSFFVEPAYAKTLAGWWQCQTTGLPQYPPTWLFSLRQLCGDLLFTAIFYAALKRYSPAAPATTTSAHSLPSVA